MKASDGTNILLLDCEGCNNLLRTESGKLVTLLGLALASEVCYVCKDDLDEQRDIGTLTQLVTFRDCYIKKSADGTHQPMPLTVVLNRFERDLEGNSPDEYFEEVLDSENRGEEEKEKRLKIKESFLERKLIYACPTQNPPRPSEKQPTTCGHT